MSKCSDTDDKAWGLSKYKYVSIKSYIAVENSRGVRGFSKIEMKKIAP